MKRIIFIFVILLSSTNLKAEFDTISVKDDYRIFGEVDGFINDSIVILTYHFLNESDSTPYYPGSTNYAFLVNYNVNAMTFTHIYEGQDTTIKTSLHSSTFSNETLYDSKLLSKDKSKLLCKNILQTSKKILVFNTSDATLDTIIDFGDLSIIHYENMYNGKVSFRAVSSSSFNQFGFNQVYVGELDLNDYSYNFYKFPDCYDDYLDHFNIYNASIVKSYRSGINEELIVKRNSKDEEFAYIESYNYDSLKISNDCDRSYISGTGGKDYYNSDAFIKFLNDDEYFINRRNGGKINIYNTKNMSSRDDSTYDYFERYSMEGNSAGYYFKGLYEDLNIILVEQLKRDNNDSTIILFKAFNYETNEFIDSMYLDLRIHNVIKYHERDFDEFYFVNDSTAFSIIKGTVVRYKYLNNKIFYGDNSINRKYILYPNPTNGILTIEYYSEKTEIANIDIIDELGKVIITSQKQIYKGLNILNYDITSYPKGIYFIRIKEQNITFKLVKE